MKIELVKCKCGSKRIVNKKYNLCDECNYKRLHSGKSKREVYAERSLLRVSQRQVNKNKEESTGGIKHKPKNRTGIKRISDTTKYRCSDGSLVSQSEITANYRLVQEQIALDSIGVCQGTGRTDLPLSFSHTISRARCKALGKTELIWDANNIEVESMGASDSAHYIWENGNLEKKKTLLNFTRKLEYIKIHDQETYKKMTL